MYNLFLNILSFFQASNPIHHHILSHGRDLLCPCHHALSEPFLQKADTPGTCKCIEGRLPACVNGGYDLVDVRDVAAGCLAALERGKKGECYILSNRHYEIKDVLRMVKMLCGGRRLPVLPMWMAKIAAPLIALSAGSKNGALCTPGTLCIPYRAMTVLTTQKPPLNWVSNQETCFRPLRIPSPG